VNNKKIIQLQIQPFTKREEWRVIPGYPNYEASDEGRIRRLQTGKVLSPGKSTNPKDSYWGVNIYHNSILRMIRVHQLVALAFIGECPEGCEIDHIDGNKLNNLPPNLEYVTHAENIKRAILNGQKPSALMLQPHVISAIKRLLRQKNPYLTYKQIAEMTGLKPDAIADIYHATRMHYDAPVRRQPRSKLTNNDVKKILYLANYTHYTMKEIAERFNVAISTVSRIKLGTYHHRAVKKAA
jgi:hypothetical protein